MKNKSLLYQWVFGSIALLFLAITTLVLGVKGHINNNDIDFTKFGTYGDFIGGVLGTIFSVIAVILIFRTYISQKEELELSRKLFTNQQFENTFFNMLKVHQELRKEINISTVGNGIFNDNQKKNHSIQGKAFFEFIQKEFTKLWKYEYDESKMNALTDKISQKHKVYKYNYESNSSIKTSNSEGLFIDKSISEHLKDIKDLKYPIFWEKYDNYIGDYFRNIYHILKYISEEKSKELKNKKNKESINKKYKKYADILQSQMSYSELFFMFYNALTFTKVKRYIEEFNFIENLMTERLLHPKHAQFEGLGKIKNNSITQ